MCFGTTLFRHTFRIVLLVRRRSIFIKNLEKAKIVNKNKKMNFRFDLDDKAEEFRFGRESIISVLPEEFSIR